MYMCEQMKCNLIQLIYPVNCSNIILFHDPQNKQHTAILQIDLLFFVNTICYYPRGGKYPWIFSAFCD